MSISTPCINICVIEPTLQICIGCGRTRGEIAQWVQLEEPERKAIMSQLPERLSAITQRGSGRQLPSARRKLRQG